MAGEEMERAIEFPLQSRASLASQVAETNGIVRLHAQTQTEFIRIVTRHIQAQGEIDASLRAAVSHTNERLDRLEALVERYLEGRSNRA
jgi:HD superfamily phosphodiesterase